MMSQTASMHEREEWTAAQPRLRPRIHPLIRECLSNKKFVFDLVDRYGSPLNLVFPQNLEPNIAGFESVYKKHRLRGRIYYVTKPCKSIALLRHAKTHDVGVDVSSVNSLKTALENGWSADRVVANGPKNTDYLSLCIKNGILINADSFDELQQIVGLHAQYPDHPVNLGVRLCGFHSAHASFTAHDATFGIHIKHLDRIIEFLLVHKNILAFKGFSFHIATNLEEMRLVAVGNVLAATLKSIKAGLHPRAVNIGGGYPIMYADDCAEWNEYTTALKKSVLGEIPPQTWNATGLGYRNENGVLAGGPMFLDHAPFRAKSEMLDYLLSSPLPDFGGQRFADILRDSLLELHIEPGKAMFDQCGITLGKVAFTKESALGETLVGLDMNRSNIQSVDQKQLTEPVVLYRDETRNTAHTDGVYYMGNLCLAYDMIQYNKTYPAKLPKRDDVVVFSNTAAYLMDFVESESLMQPVARKIAVTKKMNQWSAAEDQNYQETTP
ncbi:MAG: pyridoxal-dependent decarboxylase [Micavibrio aeruginosavorus]|uniref:Pyridoxal-dependent decarboxylase n=1 Tax=Micavibrio aeruginosavorus TaxID=349221 RepID=A0A2W5QA01_9BACT|nr:MAG: pyridoxal-dependent decarboxylase [Micavibrio aeruginosavorus]